MKKLHCLFIILMLFLTGCNYETLNGKKEVKVNIINESIEINTEHTLKELLSIENGTLINGEEIINVSELGPFEKVITIKDENDNEVTKTISFNVVDTISPEVDNVKDITVNANSKVEFYKNLKISDNSNQEVTKEINGTYDLSKDGTYELQYVVKDLSGNETIKDFKLIVKKTQSVVNTGAAYYVRVNKTMNVVMVYTKDENGSFTKLVKTFVCSAGEGTPVGTFTSSSRYETLSLVGNVYGHYTVRIDGPYWFHSVPYYSKPGDDGNWDDLEYEEYNKLGTLASKGCIRLAVKDSKWIYDNIKSGTTIEIYESNSLPDGVVKPSSIKIDVNDVEKRGWDPTDPNPNSPWN